jgi:hypothetical protein
MAVTTWTTLGFANINTTDTVDLLAAAYSVKGLEWDYNYGGDEYPKQQESANHPAHSFARAMTVTLAVQVKGSSEADYWAQRKALVAAFLVDDGAQTSYYHGTLTGTPNGQSEMYAKVNVTGIQAPHAPDEAGAFTSTVTITMRVDRGYWLKVSDDTAVKI